MFKVRTIEEMAGEAFEKAERVRMLEMMNVAGLDYEERKKSFVDLVRARKEAADAEDALVRAYIRPATIPHGHCRNVEHGHCCGRPGACTGPQ